jgi:hypothetical protein
MFRPQSAPYKPEHARHIAPNMENATAITMECATPLSTKLVEAEFEGWREYSAPELAFDGAMDGAHPPKVGVN